MRAVLLDLDETLIHERAATSAALRATLADACALRALDPEVCAAGVLAGARRLWAAGPHAPYCQRIGISSHEGLWASFAVGDDADTLGLRGFAPAYRRAAWAMGLAVLGVQDQDLCAELAERYVAERSRRQWPFAETQAVLSTLRARGLRLVLLTNGDRDLQRRKLVASGLLPLLDATVISGALGRGKPDPEVFAHALRLAEADAADAVMVGDSVERDVAGARAAGLRAVWLRRGVDGPPASGAWAQCDDLSCLPRLLEGA